MNGRDFLDVAYALLGGMREADWRSAVSRAYYAAFHAARDFFIVAGFAVPDSDQVHAYLWRRLSNSGHPDVNTAGSSLENLRRIRNWADYELGRSFDQTTADMVLRRVDDVLRLLNELPTVPETHRQIVEDVRNYEKNVLREETWGK